MYEQDFAAHLLVKALALCPFPQPFPLGDLAQGHQGSWWQRLGAQPRLSGSWPSTVATRPHCCSFSSLALYAQSAPPGGTYPTSYKFSLGEIFLSNTSQQSSHMGHRESVWLLPLEPSLGQDGEGPATLLV